MTRSQTAALVIALPVAAIAGGAAWWLYAHHKVPVLAEHLATLTGQTPAQAPTASSRGPSSPSPAVALPSPPKPSMRSAPAAQADASQPSFDVVRVEPHGDTVVAGKGAPNAKVALMSGGKVVGEAKTDSSGQFVILPPPLPPGSYDLTLRQQPENGKPATESAQSVAVAVPKPGKGSVVVALAEPGKATKLLSGPPEAPSASPDRASPDHVPPAPGKVAIRSAELENGTGFFVSGAAPAGKHVHVYLNDAHIADVTAGTDGAWSVRVRRGLTGGHYNVRADVAGAGRAVASRAEVPFDVPVGMAAAAQPHAATPQPRETVASAAIGADSSTTPPPPPAATTSAAKTPAAKTPAATGVDAATAPSAAYAPAAPGANAVLDSVATARVTTGDNLWNISRFRLGEGKRYTQIYAANAGQIRDPNLIYPGQVLVVPTQ